MLGDNLAHRRVEFSALFKTLYVSGVPRHLDRHEKPLEVVGRVPSFASRTGQCVDPKPVELRQVWPVGI